MTGSIGASSSYAILVASRVLLVRLTNFMVYIPCMRFHAAV
jgi:hypothetical protein